MWFYEESVPSDKKAVRDKYYHKINQNEEADSYDFIVSVAANVNQRTPIGFVQIWSYVEHRKSWEVGFAILPEFVGQGYGSEAAKLLLQFAFEQLGAHKVVGMCHAKNLTIQKSDPINLRNNYYVNNN